MNFKDILTQLSELEAALMRYSYQELNASDAARLKDTFSAFKDRIEDKLWAEEEASFFESLSPSARQSASTRRLFRQTTKAYKTRQKPNRDERKGQILLAEHDTRVAAFFIKHLHQAGYDVLWASYASMAKTLALNGEPDLMICSVYAKASFGKEVLQFMREPGRKHVPAILVGGAAHSDALRDTITLGAEDYLAQHITAAEIIGRVERLMK